MLPNMADIGQKKTASYHCGIEAVFLCKKKAVSSVVFYRVTVNSLDVTNFRRWS